MSDEVQRRIAQEHLPAPSALKRSDSLGVVGWIRDAVMWDSCDI